MGIKKALLCITAVFIFYGVALGGQETRGPNDLEWCYIDIALNTKSPELCYKISPKAVYTAGFSPRGHQIYYWRSLCFMDVAVKTGDVKLCEEVRTISTLFLNGSKTSKKECIACASGASSRCWTSDGYACHTKLLLEKMGYKESDIPERFEKYEDTEFNIMMGYIDFYNNILIRGLNIQDFKSRYSLLPDFSKEE